MTRGSRRSLCAACLAALVMLGSGCAATAALRVRSWDRDLLAEKQMRFNPQPMVHAVDEHIYFSKEGSIGGQDVSGGGCGCN